MTHAKALAATEETVAAALHTQYGPALATLEYFAELLKLLEDIE